MKRPRILQAVLWIALLLLSASGGLAQEEYILEGEPPLRSEVFSVLVERTGSNELILVVEWQSANCLEAFFETQVANNVISVQVASPAQIDGLVCDAPAYGEEDIFLGDDFQNDEAYAVIVNDFAGEIYLPIPGGTILDMPRQLAPVGETELVPAPRSTSSIDEISAEMTDDNTLAFTLAGEHPEGCELPVYARAVPDIVDETQHDVEVFRFLSPVFDCTDEAIPYELTLDSPLAPDDVQFVAADGRLYEWMPDEAQLAFVREMEEVEEMPGNQRRVFHVIESVEVAVLESFPMQLSLTVRGSQPDGCEVPVQVEQEVVGNQVTISIYRELPIDVMCPMVVVPYEETIMVDGSFEGGTVQIQVNDFSTSVDL